MGLENLKSIYSPTEESTFVPESENSIHIDFNGSSFFQNQGVEPRIDSFINGNIDNVNDTKLFDIPITSQPTNPTDFSTAVGNNDSAFTPITDIGGEFLQNLSWENLYNSNHTPKDSPEYKGLVPVGYSNVNRDNLKIGFKASSYGDKTGAYGFDRGDEPYIVSEIGREGRDINRGGRSTPIIRSLADIERLFKYYTSPQGLLARTLYPNANLFIPNTVVKSRDILDGKDKLIRVPQRFNNGYNPLSGAIGAFRPFGNNVPIVLGKSGFNMGTPEGLLPFVPNPLNFKNYGDGNTVPHNINNTFGGATTGGGGGFFNLSNIADTLSGTVRKFYDGDGDVMTLASITSGETLDDFGIEDDFFGGDEFEVLPDTEDEKNGMPFYFKDMRDNAYIFFRAYIEGLTENISPEWTPHNYMGRSEPVWTYERGQREISMTLKLVAQTRKELDKIYEKMERLTSLCYPRYVDDVQNYGKNRMQPPLTRMRYGDLYGTRLKNGRDGGLLGYIKSISYSIDQSSTYETEVGARTPRHILATIGYQVIHDEAPSLNMSKDGNQKFYGINQ